MHRTFISCPWQFPKFLNYYHTSAFYKIFSIYKYAIATDYLLITNRICNSLFSHILLESNVHDSNSLICYTMRTSCQENCGHVIYHQRSHESFCVAFGGNISAITLCECRHSRLQYAAVRPQKPKSRVVYLSL